jgi:hypothetical protein
MPTTFSSRAALSRRTLLPNMEKPQPFEGWANELVSFKAGQKNFCKKQFISDVNLGIANFWNFLN